MLLFYLRQQYVNARLYRLRLHSIIPAALLVKLTLPHLRLKVVSYVQLGLLLRSHVALSEPIPRRGVQLVRGRERGDVWCRFLRHLEVINTDWLLGR